MKATDMLKKFLEVEGNAESKTVDFMGENVVVNKIIDPKVASMLVSNLVKGCFSDDGVYDPFVKEFLIKLFCIMAYTDIEMPEDTAEQYMFIYRTGIFERVILPNIDQSQFRSICTAADELLAYRIRLSTEAVTSGLIDAQLELKAALDKAKSVFDGVSNEDIKGLVSAISGAKFDEEKLVKAITESIADSKTGGKAKE